MSNSGASIKGVQGGQFCLRNRRLLHDSHWRAPQFLEANEAPATTMVCVTMNYLVSVDLIKSNQYLFT